jgi:dihydroorotase
MDKRKEKSMELVIKNGNVFTDGKIKNCDIRIKNGLIAEIGEGVSCDADMCAIDAMGKLVIPGLSDAHVHLREPGFSYKETIKTGTLAAAHGGYTTICAMPNLDPVPDSYDNLYEEQEIIYRDAVVRVYPYGAITKGEKGQELSDLEDMTELAVAFSDDGKGVQSDDMMRSAMIKAKELGKLITAHCEDESLLTKGWSVHEGKYSKEHNLIGNPSESEWKQVERDLRLVRETGCGYHVCHVSTKESVELVRKAKAEGVDVTCETGPHYLALCDEDLQDDGRFRMNPPIRSREDRDALIAGILDGTVDMIATDHAPHSAEEKSGGIAGSLNGIVGLECAFPVMYTTLVKGGILPIEKLIDLMSFAAKRRFNLAGANGIKVGETADIAIFDVENKFKINSDTFLSMGKATPFDGWEVYGKCLLTLCGGEVAWIDQNM